MAPQRHGGRLASLVAVAALLGLFAPVGASATTGTKTDRKEQVRVTDRGVAWTPPLRKLHATTGTTVKVHVVNETSQSHWLKVGTHQTKPLARGGSATFFYAFTKPGRVAWLAGLGSVSSSGYHGTIKVTFPSQFN